jgi:hypothetical protein
LKDRPAFPPDCLACPPSGDGRPPLAQIFTSMDALGAAGWREVEIASQPAPSGGRLPVLAYLSADEVDAVLIGGIHGREPAGAMAIARYADRLIEHGRGVGLLVMPLLNPWGYLHHVRYGPTGQSVSDSDHLLGRADRPACPEAGAITDFVVHRAGIRPGSAVLDLHEDPVYEAPEYRFEGLGSYMYLIGEHASDHPATRRVRDCLERSTLPLVRNGITRFGEQIVDGAIVDSADGSIDELLARRLGCTPVITVENLLHAADAPPLSERVAVYLAVVDAFFGGGDLRPSVRGAPCARP